MFGNLRCPSFVPPGLARIFALPVVVTTLVVGALSTSPHVEAQTRLMFVGDSITQGGQGFASYRYPLYFDLLAAGFDVEFVGSRDFPHNNVTPNAAVYPDYFTVFDRRHEGYWGWRTDQVEQVVQTAARDHRPEVVLIHLGTNDIGQNGAAGVTAAESNLEDIIQLIRFEVPAATFLLARVVPIGPGSSYSVNADQVTPLNAVVDSVAAALDTVQSPVLVVDTNSGFDLGTMMQGDGIHPNELGEQFIANAWRATLSTLLPAGNPAPIVSLTSPSQGESFFAPATVSLVADATDSNGNVAAVRFYADGGLLATDTSPPFAFDWTGVGAGNYSLSAEAEDDQGATRRSSPVSITVAAPGSEVPIAVQNAGFEQPILADGVVQNGSGIAGWSFSGTAQTFRGVFNPPAGSYPEAAGQGTPIGAEGAQVAFLFNNGGPTESVSAVQQLTETLQAGRDYTLRVAIGKFDPAQPYSPSAYGGYRIELLAGNTVIAVDSDSQDPADLTFVDAVAVVSAASIPAALVGQPLGIRLNISATAAERSSHFDNVRLSWSAAGTNTPPEVRLTSPGAGTDFLFPATVPLVADASDANGTVAEVRFYADGSLLATDTTAPYEYSWTSATVGSYQLTAEAEDDQGAVRASTAVSITVSDPAAGVSIPVANSSFELPLLADGVVQNAGGVPRWTFRGSGQTFRGVFNPAFSPPSQN